MSDRSEEHENEDLHWPVPVTCTGAEEPSTFSGPFVWGSSKHLHEITAIATFREETGIYIAVYT